MAEIDECADYNNYAAHRRKQTVWFPFSLFWAWVCPLSLRKIGWGKSSSWFCKCGGLSIESNRSGTKVSAVFPAKGRPLTGQSAAQQVEVAQFPLTLLTIHMPTIVMHTADCATLSW